MATRLKNSFVPSQQEFCGLQTIIWLVARSDGTWRAGVFDNFLIALNREPAVEFSKE
jgi:hypothetical protein